MKNKLYNLPIEIDTLKDPIVPEFILFERENKPVKIIDKKLSWKIFKRSDSYIADAIGHPGYDKFLQTYPDRTEGYAEGNYLINIPLGHSKLKDDYAVPNLFADAEYQPKAWRWMYWGPPECGTNIHVDVDHSCAWNVSIRGYKHWWFWFDGKMVTTVQEPGEIIYTPNDILHGVRNLTTSLAITHNYKRKNG